MIRLIQLLLTIVVAVFGSSCAHTEHSEAQVICPDKGENIICPLPFEAILSHRKDFEGRLVRLDGILVVGVTEEPPGSMHHVAALFSSTERAEQCRLEFSIELEATTPEISSELEQANGLYVSLAGQLMPSQNGHWSRLEVLKPPSYFTVQKHDIDCLRPAPPAPPEPHGDK